MENLFKPQVTKGFKNISLTRYNQYAIVTVRIGQNSFIIAKYARIKFILAKNQRDKLVIPRMIKSARKNKPRISKNPSMSLIGL